MWLDSACGCVVGFAVMPTIARVQPDTNGRIVGDFGKAPPFKVGAPAIVFVDGLNWVIGMQVAPQTVHNGIPCPHRTPKSPMSATRP